MKRKSLWVGGGLRLRFRELGDEDVQTQEITTSKEFLEFEERRKRGEIVTVECEVIKPTRV